MWETRGENVSLRENPGADAPDPTGNDEVLHGGVYRETPAHGVMLHAPGP